MTMQTSPAPDNRALGHTGIGCWMLLCRALAVSVEVFLHRPQSFGDRYLGLQVGVALVLMFLFPAFWEGHDPRPLHTFLALFFVMCLVARIASLARRVRGGLGEHSHYTGIPWLMRAFPRLRENTIKGIVEPVLVWIAGGMAAEINAPLGTYLLWAGTGLFISVQSAVMAERRRVVDMHDAYLEQRRVVEHWRSRRD